MYEIIWPLTADAGPVFRTKEAAWRACWPSELAVVEETRVDARGLDVGCRRGRTSRSTRRGFWRRLMVHQLATLEYEFRTGSLALWDFYFRAPTA